MHIAERIMAAVQAALTGLPTTGARVFRAYDLELETADLPALLLSMGGTAPLHVAVSSTLTGRLEVEVTAVVAIAGVAGENVETALNRINAEVVRALKADYTLGGLVILVEEAGADAPALDVGSAADRPLAVQVSRFAVQYRRAWHDPEL